MQTGQATMKDDDRLFMKRNGFLEESYFSWSIIPLIGEDGQIVGLYNPGKSSYHMISSYHVLEQSCEDLHS